MGSSRVTEVKYRSIAIVEFDRAHVFRVAQLRAAAGSSNAHVRRTFPYAAHVQIHQKAHGDKHAALPALEYIAPGCITFRSAGKGRIGRDKYIGSFCSADLRKHELIAGTGGGIGGAWHQHRREKH